MILKKYNIILILIFILFISKLNVVIADDIYNQWDYYILEEQENMVDVNNTSADIDYEERTIKLPKLASPDIVKFTSTDSYDYVVLEENGFTHYAFDGEGMVPITSLSMEIDDPIGIATIPDYPSYFVSELGDDGSIIRNYLFTDEGMRENPILNITGYDYIYSLSTFDTGELAILTENALKTYSYDGNRLVEIPMLSKNDIEDPVAIATASNYHIAIMTEKKVEHFMFDGTAFSSVPAFDILIEEQNIENPKAIVIDDDKTFILDEKEVKTYLLSEDGMNYNAAFSISDGLELPQAIAFNRGTKDILIIDQIKENNQNKFIAKYFMFDGSSYVLNETLSREIESVAVSKRYHNIGVFITNVFTTDSPYTDMFRVRAFTETPYGTEIEFYVAYDNGEENIESLDWIPLWRVENYSNTNNSTGVVYKNGNEYGDNTVAYPITDKIGDTGDDNIDDDDIIIEDGKIIIDVGNKYRSTLWIKTDIGDIQEAVNSGRYKNFRIKAVLKTNDREVTPKIFFPMGTNNEKELIYDEPALSIEANAEPLPPDVEIEDPNKDNPPEPPQGHDDDTLPNMPDRPGFDPRDGWVYTTTPKVSWTFNDYDTEGNPLEGQTAYQVLILAYKGSNYSIIYNSGIVDGIVNSMVIPTTFDDPVNHGLLWSSGSYSFVIAVRCWDTKGAVSDFNTDTRFKVLAFERPRIANIVYPTDDEVMQNPPVYDDVSTHKMILPGMPVEMLPTAKAGAQVTLLLDSVGPIETPINDIPLFYITIDGKNIPIFMSDRKVVKTNGSNITWEFNFFTNAPITKIPDNTVVKASFVGQSSQGGTTVFYIPDFADGVVKTFETIYKDWQVIIQGRDR